MFVVDVDGSRHFGRVTGCVVSSLPDSAVLSRPPLMQRVQPFATTMLVETLREGLLFRSFDAGLVVSTFGHDEAPKAKLLLLLYLR